MPGEFHRLFAPTLSRSTPPPDSSPGSRQPTYLPIYKLLWLPLLLLRLDKAVLRRLTAAPAPGSGFRLRLPPQAGPGGPDYCSKDLEYVVFIEPENGEPDKSTNVRFSSQEIVQTLVPKAKAHNE
ncbi:hypothetical protein NDU88_001046 [Pleurodeles waltl]|uniref:Uncharacterized protein n=1 Tax=Pleurodeles waltl TaxID=8319 RepID=A0AAV7LWH4_PLEWA|nr:hypothetical protein NDU88_001046 [Pleurodeles waltl]